MRIITRYQRWLEQHWATPSYGGWVILGLTACFWLAAANTLAGWLYVLSGTCLALLLMAAWLPMRLLKGISVERSPLYPVRVGETLSLTVTLNRRQTRGGEFLLECQDQLPATFERSPWQTIAWPPFSAYRWTYGVSPQKRGAYQWQVIRLKTGAPLGLFISQRRRQCPASLLVYPELIPLDYCPIVDEFNATQAQIPEQQQSQRLGQDGTTRSLRPYRHGDARRLIHWRSSAKFNELRTRELEVIAGDSPITIALNTSDAWTHDAFESAVVAASSLFHYGQQRSLSVQLWTAGAGTMQQELAVLETLATVRHGELEQFSLPATPVLWLTESPVNGSSLPLGSRILQWSQTDSEAAPSQADVRVDLNKELRSQLQQSTDR